MLFLVAACSILKIIEVTDQQVEDMTRFVMPLLFVASILLQIELILELQVCKRSEIRKTF